MKCAGILILSLKLISYKSSRSLMICRRSCSGGKYSRASERGRESCWGRGDAIPAVKSQCCKRGQASDPDSCASLESSLQRRDDDAMISSAQQTAITNKLGCKLRYCDTNWDANWDANCETAMPCNATAYYCHHAWDSTAM